jgi:uncharacterized alkaline shock family protein YloU
LHLDLLGVAESSSRISDRGKVEVNEGVKVYVAVKDNVRVDVEVLVEVHDPVTTAQDALFYSS